MATACIIPARGGSKGIARKNLAEIAEGVSLLEWTIDQALRCYPAEDVLVSTEDAEIAAMAATRGANVIARPEELARDASTTTSVVEHLLREIDPDGARFDAIAILQVTSPLRRDADIVKAEEMLATGQFDSVVGAYEWTGGHPAKMYYLDGDKAVSVAPEYETCRRQDLPPVYRRNGSIFLATRDYFTETGMLWGGRVGLVPMPRERSIDIDAPDDLERARTILRSHRL